jgi:pilus assembly protein Flp/PilA
MREENQRMKSLNRLYVWKRIVFDESGQDLIEYALVIALIAFAATAGMSGVATEINAAFVKVGNKLAAYTT